MKALYSFQHYFDLLLATYKLFFKAARILAAFVVLLAPVQAIASVLAVNTGQNVTNDVSNHQNFVVSLII